MSNNPSRRLKRDQAKSMKMSKTGTKYFREVAQSLALMGRCHCGKSLFSYLADMDHPFNAYCLDCGSITDVRFPKKGDEYYTDKDKTPNPIKMIQYLYKNNEGIELNEDFVKTCPKDPDVNDL